ncbi:phosphoglycerate mutase (2,3-diphosphoglycerate-independent) [Candidatus Woesebacteria bacterium RIFCSPHIGHO2_01_FULL_37_10]|uniref:2,3-bisphosphoglycerate-independent phosphoglycerate mutase n=1 Tax=Candidatus Woesebacteria bacterium RIFCSPHIGHO2_01_FULL_37_10 TaxID=1802489 RepID=A0A1F7XT62_9BACT|nr:MAG: phosphoglycerate mutase (2,3-diphosphoglycerate-independent) [Candidatus Woesebacteria bacterium RIFCSPHIGHO2_01_FULL_37_10]
MSSESLPKFVVILILDGWGIASAGAGNAISLANTVNFNKFMASYPHSQLSASGEAVGLPRGEDGNTETGHLNLGAGRIVYQDLERINMAIADGTFFDNKVLIGAIDHAVKNKSKLHIMGLLGAAGVHSNIEHLYALIHLAHLKNFKSLYLHLFTDGRDSPQTASKTYLKNLSKVIENEGTGTVASIMGRYWSMDRDQRWDRTEKAYKALTEGKAYLVKDLNEAIDASYSEGKTDEFIEPSLVIGPDGKPISLIGDNDSIIFFNFRIDRPRQLTKAFLLSDFSKATITFDYDPFEKSSDKPVSSLQGSKESDHKTFNRGEKINNLYFVTMTEYDKNLLNEGANVAFPPELIDAPLSSVVSTGELRQLKITESEKERFVTFYFNGLREEPFPLEEVIIIPSLHVSTYDQKPEMAARVITDTLLRKLSTMDYQLAVVNFPNADMVGHTGNIGPTVKAVEFVDLCIGEIANFVIANEGAMLVTSDHGNAEEMINLHSGEIDTEHSNNPVPFIAISPKLLGNSQALTSGILADIAPTAISLLGLPLPSSMTGRDLLKDIKF